MNKEEQKYKIWDRVLVKVVEAGCQPYEAVVIGANVMKDGSIDYTVQDDGGCRADGYTEDWLTPL